VDEKKVEEKEEKDEEEEEVGRKGGARIRQSTNLISLFRYSASGGPRTLEIHWKIRSEVHLLYLELLTEQRPS
jgi:hypothetical protein